MTKNGIFDHFSPFEPAHGQPLDPTSAFIDITIITGCCCNDICIEKAAPGYYHPIFPLLAWKFNFLVIFGHFSRFVPAHGRPLDPTSVFIDKNVITGCCCNEIYKKKATSGYYHLILPPFPWKFSFWPFLAICAYFWATPWPHFRFYWQKYYHWVLLQ